MTQKYFKVRNGLTIDGTTSGSSNFASTATGTDLSYVLPGAQGALSTVLTNDGSGNLSWALPGGPGSTFGNITVGIETDNTISTTTGNLVLNSTSGTIIANSAGTLGFTLTPITGQSPNFVNAGNFVKGAIRDATTQANGDVWSLANGSSAGSRGLSIDNSVTPSKRPGVITRAYSTGSGVAPRSMAITEIARGNPTTGLFAVQNTDRLCEITGQGYNGTNWTGDVVANNPFTIRGQATETWSDSPRRAGTKLLVFAQPTGIDYTTTSTPSIIDHSPTTATYISDAWTFKTRTVAAGGTNTTQLTLDASGNAVINGNLEINGNTLQNSSGNTTLSMTNDNSFTSLISNTTAFVAQSTSAVNSNISFTPGDIMGAGPGDRITQFGLFHYKDPTTTEYPVGSYNNWTYNDSTSQFEATLNNQVLGQFWFTGNTANSATINGITGARFGATATENWTATNAGTKLTFEATANGSIVSQAVLDISPETTNISSDIITLEDSTGNDYLTLDATTATFTQDVFAPTVTIGNDSTIDTVALTTTSTTTVPFVLSTRNAMTILVNIIQGADVHCVNATVLRNGATAMLTTYGEMYNTTPLATFTADVSGGAVRLLVTPTSATSTVFSAVRTSLT